MQVASLTLRAYAITLIIYWLITCVRGYAFIDADEFRWADYYYAD